MAASERSVGKRYEEACGWKLSTPMPDNVKKIEVQSIEPPLDCDVVFSSLPGSVARDAEVAFATAGFPVISNSSCFRMEKGYSVGYSRDQRRTS